MMETRAQPKVITTRTGSFDLQNVDIGLRMLFRPAFDEKAGIDKLPEVFERLGPDYEERVLPGIANEVMKAVVVRVRWQKVSLIVEMKYWLLAPSSLFFFVTPGLHHATCLTLPASRPPRPRLVRAGKV